MQQSTQRQVITANAKIMSFMLFAIVIGFFTIGVASANAVGHQSGSWVNKDYKVHGEWSIEQRGDQRVIKFNDKFKTKKGPDLKVFLSPQTIDDVTGATATDGALLVSALTNNKGEQEYVLPEGVEITDYKSLLIHCEAFSVLWGGGEL